MKYKKLNNKYNTICIISICILLAILLYIMFFIYKNKCIKEKYTTKYKYTAIIVEPREHKALSFVLNNFLENLSDEWGIVICHGNKNIDFIHTIIDNHLSQYTHRITLVNLMVDNLSIEDYNNLLTSEKFYEYIPTETFIVFQTDTMICPEYKEYIHKFIEYDYDYVGAPWNWDHDNRKNSNVGNGGLSLRKKSKMLEIINKESEDKKNLIEDVFFARSKVIDLYKPEPEEAFLFSIENIHGNNYPFGCHQPWNIPAGNGGINSTFCQMYPEIIELYNLQY
jgi:hypothetical protein